MASEAPSEADAEVESDGTSAAFEAGETFESDTQTAEAPDEHDEESDAAEEDGAEDKEQGESDAGATDSDGSEEKYCGGLTGRGSMAQEPLGNGTRLNIAAQTI